MILFYKLQIVILMDDRNGNRGDNTNNTRVKNGF